MLFNRWRCAYCRHFIWPHHHFGFFVWADDGSVTRWHTQCRRKWWLAGHPEDA